MKTHITLIIDRSGSMGAIRDDAQGALNTFIKDQKELKDDCSFLMCDFDTQDPLRVYFDCNIQEVDKEYKLEPRGGTPLMDAVGHGIAKTAEIEADQYYVAIVTDGGENSSTEYSGDDIKELISQKESEGWEFIFMAAGQEAWNQSTVFAGTNMINTNYAQTSTVNYGQTMDHLSTSLIARRSGDTTSSFSVDNS